MKAKILKALSWLSLLAIVFSSPVVADEDAARLIRQLQDQMKQMQRTIEQQGSEIQQLKNRPAQVVQGGSDTSATPPMSDFEFNERLGSALGGANKWLKDLSFKGDLRLRYEAFDFTNGTTSETDARNRFRYRLRMGWEKKFSEEMKIGFGLASGEQSGGTNVDPTSTNTTFDNNFNWKSIFIEHVYASYSPEFLKIGPVEKFNITAGKFGNPFEKGSSDMVWDRDVKPEGLYEKVDVGLLDGENFDFNSYFTAGQFILDEDATSGGDAELFAYQLGLNAVLYTPMMERPVDWLGAVSFYSYNDYAHKSNFLIGTTSLARGNTNVAGSTADLDAGDFEIWEVYNEISFYPMGVPIRPFFDVANNMANQTVGDESLAWSLGTKVGGILKKGDWEISYAYKRIEPDSVVGAFNDSDFGNGHSGKRGSAFKAGYALTDAITTNFAAFFVNNLTTGTGGVLDEEQRRFQVDLVWKF